MKNGRGLGLIGVMSGLAMVLSIVALVWAAFSTELTVSGNATVNASKWEVKFTNFAPANTTGTATATTPELNATTFGNYTATLTTPGDSVSYDITVENLGTYDAEITSVTVPTPTCTGTPGAETATTDATHVCDKLTYTLKYQGTNTNVAAGDKLAKASNENTNDTKVMTLTLTYGSVDDDDESLLPVAAVTVSNLGFTLTYGQDNGN